MSEIRRQSFKEWFIERYPDCGDAIVIDTREKIWFAKAGENQQTALLRLADALSEYLELTH